ncbi:MAG: hypothetical protein ACE147_10715 [Candidatus Methylomirabilales bacterium]
MASPDALRDEDRRVRQLQIAVGLALGVIAQGDLAADEAWDMVWATRRAALALFPGKERAFDLIYLPRFLRLLAARYPGNERVARFLQN